VVERALDALRAIPEGQRLLWATSASGDYPVWVGPLDRAPWPAGGRRVVVSDETVALLHAGRVPDAAGLVEIPAGEEHKTLQTAERVWHALVAQGVTRADHLVALGGGVVGDVAGFCAATYQRGIGVVQVPTTLVAQVDSAYGGKTGVDLPEAKNYVGAYHQPVAVLTDPALLATLPGPELAAGYAEVVKTALIAGGTLWDRVSSGAAVDDDVIVGCARTKLRVVAADERDGGARQALNLGHTVGHAIETATGYARYRHGEAVGLGLLAALRLSGQDALRDLVQGLLTDAGLPTRLEDVDPAAVAEATARDKKRTGEAVPYVLVEAPGRITTGHLVGAPEVLAAVRELCAS
jgi:shikimate kinase / 3-dehydroquinate synthase